MTYLFKDEVLKELNISNWVLRDSCEILDKPIEESQKNLDKSSSENLKLNSCGLIIVVKPENESQIFSKKAQLLFDKMLLAIGFNDYVLISNFENVNAQIKQQNPKVILEFVTHKTQSVFAENDFDATIINTFHPEYLLKNPKYKKQVWRDLIKVFNYL